MINKNIIPCWFTEKMTNDNWAFGLLASCGKTICIERIDEMSQAVDGTIWIDVVLLPDSHSSVVNIENRLTAPSSRRNASLNCSHIVAAYELQDT